MNNLQLQTKIFLGAIAGIIVARSFATTNTWFLIPIGIAIWWAGTHKRKLSDYMFFSFSFSIWFWFTHISWLSLVGIDAYILLATLMSLIYGFSGYLMYKVRNLYFPFVWYALIFISIETLTDYFPFGGFPWGKLAYASADAPWANLMPFGSAPLVTFAILIIAVLLIPTLGFAIQKAFTPAIVFTITIIVLNLALLNLNSFEQKPNGTIDLAIIQGSVPRSGLLFNEQKTEVLKFHINETNALLQGNNRIIDAIMWPENSIDVDPFENKDANFLISSLLDKYQIPLLSGAVVQKSGGLENSVLLWDPISKTIEDRYVKSILVPFGEYLPFRETLSKYIKRFDLIPQDFIPGNNSSNLVIGNTKISPIVCFEVAWNKTLIEQINTGGEIVSVHTNNATYAFSNQLDQQFVMTRLRAIETGREVVVSATTGISSHIDNKGNILWQSKEFVPESKIVTAKLYSNINFAMKHGNKIRVIALLGFIAPLLFLIVKYLRRKK